MGKRHTEQELMYKDERSRVIYCIDDRDMTFGEAIIRLMEVHKMASFEAWEYLQEIEAIYLAELTEKSS